jgi:2-oxoglutarate dehydrogenase E2 component (dihydrolipoamide succinyltransferase)
MKIQIKVPAVGESITEGTIAQWTKKSGEYVKRDEVVMMLETDKASVEVVAEASGTLTQTAKAGDVVKIGAVIGEIDSDGKPTGAGATAEPPKVESKPPPQPQAAKSAPATATNNNLSPAVRRVVAEGNLNPEQITGTGKDGRITKADAVSASNTPATTTASTPVTYRAPDMGRVALGEEIVREPMSTIRKRIAERLVEAQNTAAILTTFNEIDMTEVMALRTKYKEKFEKKYGIGLGFMGFFVKAVIEALKAFPKVNAFIDGTDIVYHRYHNVGVAVGTEKGLFVPVLKHAEHMSLAEVEMAIKHYAQKAKDGKISIEDLSGGTFTISNGGVYGSLMSTPILNPPQSGILGMHKIEQRPVVINGKVEIRPMMYVALSYDHRIIDGGESVSFLVRVKDCIEDPSRVLLEI